MPIEPDDLFHPPRVAPELSMLDARAAVGGADSRWAVVVDDDARLQGWIDLEPGLTGSVKDHLVPFEVQVPVGTSLRCRFRRDAPARRALDTGRRWRSLPRRTHAQPVACCDASFSGWSRRRGLRTPSWHILQGVGAPPAALTISRESPWRWRESNEDRPYGVTPRQRHCADSTCEDDGTEWERVVLIGTRWHAPSPRASCPARVRNRDAHHDPRRRARRGEC